MPAILFVVLGVGALAYLMQKGGGGAPPPGGMPLPPVLPGQAPGTSFGPGFSLQPAVAQQAPAGLDVAAFSRFAHLGLAPTGAPLGHDAAPMPVPVPTPTPVQVPGVQHVMVATHDTGPSGNLAIRPTPSKSGAPLAEAPHGSVLAVTGPNVDDPNLAGGWSPVLQESTGIHGYSATAYLKAI